MATPHIVILGAGYGGLMTATQLQKKVGAKDCKITLVDKNDCHYETTWLHEVAAGTIRPHEATYEIKDVINRKKVEFLQDSVVSIDKKSKKVKLEKSVLTYDYLVIGLGFESETFGISGLKEHAFSIANINAARKLREHIELQFATYNTESPRQNERLTIAVGGAGFTGIEFLGELAQRVPELCREYDVDRSKVRMICVEASPSALMGFDQDLIDYAVNHLEQRGVEFKIGTAIKECSSEGIVIAKEEETEEIKAGTVVWAAGVRGNEIVEDTDIESMRARVKVDEFMRVPEHDDIFIVGDCALIINEEINRPYPPTAQIAMQEAEVVAKSLASIIKGSKELTPFKYSDKGTVCSLGHDDATGKAFGKKFYGFTASILKKLVDNRALFLIGGVKLVLRKGKFNIL